MHRSLCVNACGLLVLIGTSASLKLGTRQTALPDTDEEESYDKDEFTAAMQHVHDLNMRDKTYDLNTSDNNTYDSEESNLCIDGRLVPSIFLIGSQKGATSTLAGQLESSPGIVFGRDGKELHFFNSEAKFQRKGGKDGYLDQFPPCPLNGTLVALDATPHYFMSEFAPGKIRDIYGNAAGKLKFIVTLREPMRRMHSAFYHARKPNNCNKTTHPIPWGVKPSVCETSFNDYVKGTLETREGSLWEHSSYPWQFRQWFDVFPPSQFMIVPFLYVVDASRGGGGPFYEHVWRTFHVPLAQHVPDHLNVKKGTWKEHPSFEDDIAPDTLEKANEAIQTDSSSGAIASILHKSGATLWDCSGCDDEGSIARWIEANWG